MTSKSKQAGIWRISNYTLEYRETSGIDQRKLMGMDEVPHMDVDRASVIICGKNVLKMDKYNYSTHPEAKKPHLSNQYRSFPASANTVQETQKRLFPFAGAFIHACILQYSGKDQAGLSLDDIKGVFPGDGVVS